MFSLTDKITLAIRTQMTQNNIHKHRFFSFVYYAAIIVVQNIQTTILEFSVVNVGANFITSRGFDKSIIGTKTPFVGEKL